MNTQEPRIKLLLVDDEEDFLAAVADALVRRGIDIVTATRGDEALSLAKEQRFDVVILDVKMPGMDGVEVFRILRSQEPDLPVIMLTGHGTVTQAFATAKEGIFDYLAKPCDMEMLAQKVRAAALSRWPQDETTDDLLGEPRVLLVDDELELLDSLRTVLVRRRLEVATAPDGNRALAMLAERGFDVVVLDMKMPGLDGLEVLRQIKRDRPNVEVILLTGHPTVDNALEGVKLGAFEYVTKPPDIEQLAALIHKACEHRRQQIDKQQQDRIRNIRSRFGD